MPYSFNRPPVPIDKTKQGGKNMDASKITDLKKIETIVAVGKTKVGFNNKNLITNLDEKNRARLLSNTLPRIPEA
jgi:hypothetical protein